MTHYGNPFGYDAPSASQGDYGVGGLAPPSGQDYGALPAQKYPAELTKAAAAAIATAMGSDCYALVGGAACTLLGSTRATEDIDFVVPQGQTPAARNKLRKNSAFEIEAGTNHTKYVQAGSSPVAVEILAPPGLFKGQFSTSTPCLLVNNVRILKPTLILDAKCGSILGRASDGKKQTDALDIKFLLVYIARYGMSVGSEVPNATGEFITWFASSYGGKELFQRAGFTVPGGMFFFSEPLPYELIPYSSMPPLLSLSYLLSSEPFCIAY